MNKNSLLYDDYIKVLLRHSSTGLYIYSQTGMNDVKYDKIFGKIIIKSLSSYETILVNSIFQFSLSYFYILFYILWLTVISTGLRLT